MIQYASSLIKEKNELMKKSIGIEIHGVMTTIGILIALKNAALADIDRCCGRESCTD